MTLGIISKQLGLLDNLKVNKAGLDGHRSAPGDNTAQPPPLCTTTCDITIFSMLPCGDAQSPPGISRMETHANGSEGSTMQDTMIHNRKGGREFTWDKPPDLMKSLVMSMMTSSLCKGGKSYR